VRWRLKEALTRLRAGLDDDYGDRAAWLPLMLPARTRSRPRVWLWSGLAVGGVGGLLVVGVWRGSEHNPAPSVEGAARASASLGPPRLLAARGSAGSDETCPAVEPLRARLTELRRASDPWRNVTDVFENSPPNPGLAPPRGWWGGCGRPCATETP